MAEANQSEQKGDSQHLTLNYELSSMRLINGADGISDVEHVAIEGMELLGEAT